MSSGKLVCPQCGGSRFTSKQIVNHHVVLDGEGNVMDSMEDEAVLRMDYRKCTTCLVVHDSMNDLVTEQYFHHVICAQSV